MWQIEVLLFETSWISFFFFLDDFMCVLGWIHGYRTCSYRRLTVQKKEKSNCFCKSKVVFYKRSLHIWIHILVLCNKTFDILAPDSEGKYLKGCIGLGWEN